MFSEDTLQHQHYDLNHIEAGRIVEVALDGAANVRIMDHASYQDFKAGRKHGFIGGYVKESPYRAAIPTGGHWHVVLDLGGQAGRLRSGVRVLQGQLAPVRTTSLAVVPSLYIGKRGDARAQDVFIVHVAEDKAVVRTFAFALRKKGLRVSYDDFELDPEDSVYQKVNTGMENSCFGVVVVSRSLVKQGWVEGGIAQMAVKTFSGKQVLLPLWHDIMREEVLEFCADIANLESRNTAVNTFEEIAEDIAGLILI